MQSRYTYSQPVFRITCNSFEPLGLYCTMHMKMALWLWSLQQVNQELGEIGGVFVSKQPSDTDMGAKAPRTV